MATFRLWSMITPKEQQLLEQLRQRLQVAELRVVEWEVLPPEHVERIIEEHKNPQNGGANPNRREWPERIEFLRSLRPECWVQGRLNGSRVYLVALFRGGQVAIADTAKAGNAIYAVMGGAWADILSLYKSQARAAGAIRIYHSSGWQRRVRQLTAIS